MSKTAETLFFAFEGDNGRTYFFAALSEERLLAVTNNGTNGGAVPLAGDPTFLSRQQVSEEDVRKALSSQQLPFLRSAPAMLMRDCTPAFWIGTDKTD